MIVALVATGMRVISRRRCSSHLCCCWRPPALIPRQRQKMRTEEVDARRADYTVTYQWWDNIRAQAAEQQASALWSHLSPALASVPGNCIMAGSVTRTTDFWCCGPAGTVPLATTLRVNDTAGEVDWNRCRTVHYAACSTPSAALATCRPGST